MRQGWWLESQRGENWKLGVSVRIRVKVVAWIQGTRRGKSLPDLDVDIGSFHVK